MIMTNVNDLNIKFNNKFEKKILSDNSVKIIFFNKKRKISYIPSWFDQKIISFLEKTEKNCKITCIQTLIIIKNVLVSGAHMILIILQFIFPNILSIIIMKLTVVFVHRNVLFLF